MEPVQLPPGCEVAVTISTPDEAADRWEEAVGGWAGLVDTAALLQQVYRARESARSTPGDTG